MTPLDMMIVRNSHQRWVDAYRKHRRLELQFVTGPRSGRLMVLNFLDMTFAQKGKIHYCEAYTGLLHEPRKAE